MNTKYRNSQVIGIDIIYTNSYTYLSKRGIKYGKQKNRNID
jgi:hypothetical protein